MVTLKTKFAILFQRMESMHTVLRLDVTYISLYFRCRKLICNTKIIKNIIGID